MRRQNTKELILHQSILLFGKMGFERVSVRQIATAVGIKESSIYNHYQSKEEILDDIMNYFQERHVSHWVTKEFLQEKLKTEPFEQVLGYYFYQYSQEEYEEMLNMFRILFMEQFRKEHFRNILLEFLMRRQEEYLVEMFQGFIREGYLHPFDCVGMARLWNNNNIALAMEACHVSRNATSFRGIYKLCISLLMQYATEKGRKAPQEQAPADTSAKEASAVSQSPQQADTV